MRAAAAAAKEEKERQILFIVEISRLLVCSPSFSYGGQEINISDVCIANLFIYDQFMWLQMENYYGFLSFLLAREKSQKGECECEGK